MKFTTEFDKLLKSTEWISNDEYKKVYHLFSIDKNDNELYLLNKLEEFSLIKWHEFILKFYTTTGFIKYLWENYNFTNEKISEKLKEILDFILNEEKPEKYSYTLEVFFSINKNDNEYYINQYEELWKLSKLYHDINETFLEIFIKLKVNDKFISAFQKNIIDNATEVYYFSVKRWFEYLISLDNNNFKKYFLKLLDFFNLKENKQKLIHFHEYTSLIRSYDKKEFSSTITYLLNKIDNALFSENELNTIRNFIIWDIDFAIEHHERNILNNIFINELFKYFNEKDNTFLLEMLSSLKSKYLILSLEPLIVEYLKESQIEDIIKLYKDTDNSNILYFTYDRLMQSWKNNMVELFEKSSIWSDIKKRNIQIEKNNKKFENDKQKRLEKDKQNFFKMIKPWKWKYYPKLFQDYSEYIRNKKLLESIFTSDEISKINTSIKKQIKVYLEALEITDYNDEKISRILTFEKKQENSYSHTWNSVYLWWIIDISKNIKFDLDKYYKSFVLFYPLLWWEEKINDTLEIIWDNINSKDIDYILKVYSEDLHENAKWLRYYHVDTLHDFYEKFKLNFTAVQKKRLESICLDIINWESEDNIYYKENFLHIYSEIGWEKKLLKLWNQWNTKYKNFNYYKDYLDNDSIDKKEKDSFKFLTFIAKELIKTYQNKKIILWTINQVKNGLIEAVDIHEIKYPHRSASFSWLSEKESELWRWWSDKYNFSYIFKLIPNVDILNDFLELLKYSFSVQEKILNWELEWNYELYCFYIRWLFYKYVKNLDSSLLNKDYYYKIKDLLNKYDYKITYNFNLSDIKDKFWIDNIEEEAKEIIDAEWIDWVVKLLKEKYEKWSELASKDNEENLKYRRKKYIVFVEWPTDVNYIIKAWEFLWKTELLEMIDIFIIWEKNDKWETNKSNDDYLKYWWEFLSVNPDFIPYWVEKVLFLHDPENWNGKLNIKEAVYQDTIFIKLMKLNENNVVNKWIEWLFNKNFIDKVIDNNWNSFSITENTIWWKKTKKVEIIQWYKKNVQEWICKNWSKKDFLHFNHIFDLIQDIIDWKV